MVSELGDVETRSLAERRMEKGVGCPEGTPTSQPRGARSMGEGTPHGRGLHSKPGPGGDLGSVRAAR